MAPYPPTRRVIADSLLVGGVVLVIGAQAIDDWWYFLGVLGIGIGLVTVSLVLEPMKDRLARLGRAPVRDAAHELNVHRPSKPGPNDANQ